MRRSLIILTLITLLLCGCSGENKADPQEGEAVTDEMKRMVTVTYDMQMKIGDTPVSVTWEDNDAVKALAEMTAGDWHDYRLSMYGGFEQVGALGFDLPRDDRRTTTQPGDLVLYQGNQIVVFYGTNTWEYTGLGHIADQSEEDLRTLLGNGNVTLTLRKEGQ